MTRLYWRVHVIVRVEFIAHKSMLGYVCACAMLISAVVCLFTGALYSQVCVFMHVRRLVLRCLHIHDFIYVYGEWVLSLVVGGHGDGGRDVADRVYAGSTSRLLDSYYKPVPTYVQGLIHATAFFVVFSVFCGDVVPHVQCFSFVRLCNRRPW